MGKLPDHIPSRFESTLKPDSLPEDKVKTIAGFDDGDQSTHDNFSFPPHCGKYSSTGEAISKGQSSSLKKIFTNGLKICYTLLSDVGEAASCL